MPRRRKFLLLFASTVAVLLAIAAWGFHNSFANRFSRVREGMTKSEVVALLGPPGNHIHGHVRCLSFEHPGFQKLRDHHDCWENEHGHWYISFDAQDRVTEAFHVACMRPETLGESLDRWWCGVTGEVRP